MQTQPTAGLYGRRGQGGWNLAGRGQDPGLLLPARRHQVERLRYTWHRRPPKVSPSYSTASYTYFFYNRSDFREKIGTKRLEGEFPSNLGEDASFPSIIGKFILQRTCPHIFSEICPFLGQYSTTPKLLLFVGEIIHSIILF
jgi:hypothetical protein